MFYGHVGISSLPFISWVNSHCSATIDSSNCLKCYTYSPSQCYADQNSCYSTYHKIGSTCPYTICREPFLGYFVDNAYFVYIAGLAYFAFQCSLLIGTIFLYLHSTYAINRNETGGIIIHRRAVAPKTITSISYPVPRRDDVLPLLESYESRRSSAISNHNTGFVEVEGVPYITH